MKFGNMSRIGKKPIEIPAGVEATINGKTVAVKGPKGALSVTLHPHVTAIKDGQTIAVTVANETEKTDRSLWGLTATLINNMILGVTKGFEKKLELSGVGYRAQVSGEELTLHVGFSHPVKITPATGIKFSLIDNVIVISGIDKSLVGDTAAKIRAIRPPEPYKGKGIKYQGEVIRRKAGKAAKAVGGAK